MASYGQSELKFFESGFLTLGTGKVVLGLNNISIDYTVELEELLTFDLGKVKSQYPTFSSWTASASGKFLNLNSDAYSPLSADTRVTGGTSGAYLLETIKLKQTLPIVFKLDTANYQTSSCILTSYSLTADAGGSMEYSIELTGTADLIKATS